MQDKIIDVLNSLSKRSAGLYADARLVDRKEEHLLVKDGQMEGISRSFDRGIGIRVLARGAWGFAATADLSAKGIQDCGQQAIEVAQASSLAAKKKVQLAEEDIYVCRYTTPFKEDPFKVSLARKKRLLLKVGKALAQKGVKTSACFLDFYQTEKLFINTEGSVIQQAILESGGGLEVTAVGEREVQRRSFPSSFGGNLQTGGYEVVEELGLLENAERVREEAMALLKAKPAPCGEFDLILMPPQLCLQIHESCGHAVELDRVFGMETSFAGETFLTPEKRGKFRYGSKLVNITADTELDRGLGTFGFDDEGVKGKKVQLIREGIFRHYLSSRETAQELGEKSSGAARAESWHRIPLIRMTNITLEPGGAGSLADLLSLTDRAILMDVNKSWSIDSKRLQFQFGCEAGWEIKRGKKVRLVKNPIYSGITPHFWRSCAAICSAEEFKAIGLANCGKGIPGQSMHVGHGAAPALFRKVQVGAVGG